MKNSFERHPSAMYLILAVALLIGYSPVYLSTYGFSDDWFYLYASTTDAFSIFKWDILSGRPFYGAIRYFFAFLIDDVQDLTAPCTLIIKPDFTGRLHHPFP